MPGDDTVTFKDGRSFMDIINKFASEVPQGSIQTAKKVTKIDWSQLDNATIEINNGEDEAIRADYVIFTGSLGFLKENYMELFDPL